MKSILIVNHYATPPMYGGLNRHHFFAKNLKKMGYNVKIIASSAIHNSNVNMINKDEKILYKEKVIDDVDYIYVKTSSYKNKYQRIINMLQFYFKTKKTVKKIDNFDVIYSSTPQPLSALLGIRIAKKYKSLSIVEVRDLWPATIVDFNILSSRNVIIKILFQLEKYIYKNCDRLIFTMEGGKEYIKDHKYNIDLNKIFHINNGVDLKKFKSDLNNNKIDDKDLNNKKDFKVIYTGSIREAYNIDQLLELAKFVKKKGYNDIKFLIYGKGPYLEKLKNKCIEDDIDNVSFKGFVDAKYIPYILSKAEVTLLQSINYDSLKYGTSQNKLFTYLAAGKPIISTMDNKYDLIKKYKCGISLKKTDISNYYKALMVFYNMDKKQYKEYCDNCKKLVLDYDYVKLTEKLVKIIEE